MKIVIVENPRPLTIEHYNDVANAPLSASLNSGYALAVARRSGWHTAYLDFSSGAADAESMAADILAEAGDLILFHWVYSWGNERSVHNVMELLRRDSDAPMGAFGLFPTISSSRLLQYASQLDFILVGEFEETLAELLLLFGEQRAVTPLPGVVLRDGSFVPRPLIADLARLPVPADVGVNCNHTTLNIAASRGCTGKCSFCFIHSYYGCSRRRIRDTASLERELAERLTRREIGSLYFIDPTFVGHGEKERERAIAIGRLAQGLGLPFGFETRVDTLDATVLTALAKSGATSIFLGIESGCDAVLARIGKGLSTDQIRRGVRMVRESGMQLHLGFIMFEPDSTLAELEENYNFLEALGLLAEHELTANLLYHNQIVLYGSTAWERFEREGRLLLDRHLPFEARYRFRDDRVGLVCTAMGRLSTEYFRGIDALRTAAGASGTYSRLLKNSGCSKIDRLSHPQKAPRRRSNATPHKEAFEDGGEMAVFEQPPRSMQKAHSHGFNSSDVNELLKEAFLALCAAAGKLPGPGVTVLVESYLRQLRTMLSGKG